MFFRLLFIVLLLSGCASATHASLHEVRAFADASASLTGYAELADRYRNTYQRERPYLSTAADKLARANDAKRQVVYADFVNVQKAVVRYMQTLSLLAGDARYDLGPRFEEVNVSLQATTDSGLTQRHVIAYAGMTRLLARVGASGYQQHSVDAMVRDGAADLQTLLDAMVNLTRLYARTNENEKKTVLGLLDVELATAPRNTDRLLLVLGRVHLQEKTAEYQAADKRYDLAMQGLTRVALGHQKLREHLGDLTRDDTRVMLQGYANDLAMIHDGLRE